GADLPCAFNNNGLFKKTGGTSADGAATIGVPFNNTGTVDLQIGTLVVRNGVTSTGPWTIAAPATLQFDGDGPPIDFKAGSVASGTGAVAFEFGTVTFADTYSVATTRMNFGGTANFNAAATTGTLDLSGWTLGGSGDFTVNGLFTWRSGVV